MNTPPKEYIRVNEDRLLAFITSCFEQAGIDHMHAALISRLLVNNDLRGIRSHASYTATGYCAGFASGHFNPKPTIHIVQETAATTVIDGDGTLGYWPMVQAAQAAVAKAQQTGVGLALVRHIGHYGSAGHYTRICMEQGCIGFSLQGYRNEAKIDPQGKRSAALSGNPPISFAIPGGEEPDFVLDGGTSLFDPCHGTALDELLAQVPSAVFKSMGFIAIATLLGGGLTGFTLPTGDAIASRWGGAQMGGMILAIHTASLMPDAIFRAEVDRYTHDLRTNHKPVPGTDRIVLPGHLEAERMTEYRRDGIPFDIPEQQAMQSLHERYQVALPWD